MVGYASITLAMLSMATAIGTGIVAYSMYRLLQVYKSRRVEYALAGFIFLTIAQVLSAASYLIETARLAYALFVASTSASLSSYLLILYSMKPATGGEAGMPLLLATGLTIPALLDAASAVAAAGIAARSMKQARRGFALISMAHLARAAAIQAGTVDYLYVLLVGETVRVIAVALLVLYYAGRVLRVAPEV